MNCTKRKSIFLCAALTALMIFCFTTGFSVAAENPIPLLTDENGYLTAEEAETVSEKLTEIYEQYNFRLVVYTEPELPSGCDDGKDRARELYYAYDDFDGMIFYISGDRYYYLLTVGVGYYVFDDAEITAIEDEILPYMSNDEMYDAFLRYAETGESILNEADLDAAYSEYEEYMNEYSGGAVDNGNGSVLFTVLLVLLIPLIVAFIITGVKSAGMKTARAQSGAADYLRSGSLNIKQQQDIYLYSTVTQTAKPEPESHSGGSSGGGGRGPTGGHGGRF